MYFLVGTEEVIHQATFSELEETTERGNYMATLTTSFSKVLETPFCYPDAHIVEHNQL